MEILLTDILGFALWQWLIAALVGSFVGGLYVFGRKPAPKKE